MLTSGILAGLDDRHTTPPPELPPRRRFYVATGALQIGDMLWDGTTGRWLRSHDSWAGTDVRKFLRVCRKRP